MNLFFIENDFIDIDMAQTYCSYGTMVERLFHSAGSTCSVTIFTTYESQFPNSYDAVLLTGSRADSFSKVPWIIATRRHVCHLLETLKKLLGICFRHQPIALCLRSRVGRALQGWGIGCITYPWHSKRTQFSLLASHPDQVFDLSGGVTLLASNLFCPVASFNYKDHVFCVQAHPEFVTDYSTYLLDKRRSYLSQ